MLEVTKDEMGVLIRLQANEDKRDKIQFALNKIPDEIALVEKKMTETEEEMRGKELAFETQKKKYRDCEGEIKLRQENIKKSDLKLMSIKKNEEYKAVLKEIEDLKRQIGKLEDEMLKILFDIEEQEKRLAEERENWEAEKSLLAEEKQALEAQRRQEEQRLSGLNDEWREIADNAPRTLMDAYREVQGRVSGNKAVAEVMDYVCQGCFMNIPAQLYNELHTTNTLRFCPFCNRIIFVNGKKET